jgi:hypothetical protein
VLSSDPLGRVLPQTHVTAVQISTGLKRETTFSAEGMYDIPDLSVGNYTIQRGPALCPAPDFEPRFVHRGSEMKVLVIEGEAKTTKFLRKGLVEARFVV